MLDNWLKTSIQTKKNQTSTDFIAARVLNALPTQKSHNSVYIISDGSVFSTLAKESLFALHDHFQEISFYDLGILKNKNPESVISLLRSMIPLDGKTIILSQDHDYLDSIFRALEYSNAHINLAYINSRLDQLLEDRTARSLESQNLLNLSIQGFQRHFCSRETLSFIYESLVNHRSYGEICRDIEKSEPILRNIDAFIFSNKVLQDPSSNMPNGLNGLQACQLAKYAGMGSMTKIFHISNAGCNSETQFSTLAGQMIWYFIEGIANIESTDNIGTSDHFKEHLVQTSFRLGSLVFWKSNRSGRWWFEIPNPGGQRGNLYPCSQEDYDLARRDEISEYLLNQINLDH